MGSNRYTYIGPYLIFKSLPTKQVEVKDTIKHCSNETCINHKKITQGKFCNQCGEPIVKSVHTRNETTTIGAYELTEEFGNPNMLCIINGDYLRSNKALHNAVTISDFQQDEEMECPKEEEAINEFRNEYQSFLTFLDLHEGKPQYEIKFGVLSYWN